MRLTLYYPCKPYIINQHFGDNWSCVEDTPNVPVTKRKVIVATSNGVCPAGYTNLYKLLGMGGHTGMDLGAGDGIPLYASIDGVVEEVQTEPERGLGVGIISDQKFDMDTHGTHFAKVRYWHLKSINVKKGQSVKVGDLLGLADSTGLSSGSHLHYELKPVEYDPNKGWYNTEQNNTSFGAIDPEPYFYGKYAENRINHFFLKDIKFGDEGEEVYWLQRALKALNWYDGPITGFYGPITQKWVKAFQTHYKVASWAEIAWVNGKSFGPKSRAKLQSLI